MKEGDVHGMKKYIVKKLAPGALEHKSTYKVTVWVVWCVGQRRRGHACKSPGKQGLPHPTSPHGELLGTGILSHSRKCTLTEVKSHSKLTVHGEGQLCPPAMGPLKTRPLWTSPQRARLPCRAARPQPSLGKHLLRGLSTERGLPVPHVGAGRVA